MSLRTKLGFIFIVLSVLYLFVVPVVNPDSPHAYVEYFILLGIAGVIYMYVGRNDKETKGP